MFSGEKLSKWFCHGRDADCSSSSPWPFIYLQAAMANTSGSRSPHRSWPCSLSPWPLTQVLLAGPGASGVLGIILSHQEDSGSTAPRVGSAQLQGEPGWTGVCDACVHGIVLSPGPATSVLFLLCCLGGWLTSHTLPVHFLQPSDIQKIVEELQSLSKMLLKDVSALEISFLNDFFKMPSIALRRGSSLQT